MASARAAISLSFSEDFPVGHSAHVFKASVNEGAGFVNGGGDFADILIGEFGEGVGEMDVLERILNVLVSQQALHVHDVLGLRVFHRGFPMTERAQANQVNPWVQQPSCDALPLLTVVPRKIGQLHGEAGAHESGSAAEGVIRMTRSVEEEGDVHLGNGFFIGWVLADYVESDFLIQFDGFCLI